MAVSVSKPVVAGLIFFCFLLSVFTAVYSPLPLFALILIGLGTLVFLFPAYGIMVVISFFLIQLSPIYQQYGIIARSITASDLVAAIAIAGWITQEMTARHTADARVPARGLGAANLSRTLSVIAVAAYSLWVLVSGLWSSTSAGVILSTTRTTIESALLFVLVVMMIRTEKLARHAAGVYAATCIGLALYTIDHFNSIGGFGSGAYLGSRLAGSVYRGGLTDASNYMSVILACAPAFAFFATAGLRGWLRWVLGFAPIPIILLAIAILSSREAYVSLVVAVVASVLIAGEFRYRLTAAVLLTLAGIGVFLALNANSLPFWVTQRFTTADVATVGSRAPFWIIALHLFAQNPLGGLGLGGFEDIISHYHVNPYLGVSATHNQYVNALVDSGFFGFVLLVAMIGALGYVLIRNGRHPALLINWLVIVVDMSAGDVLGAHFAWAVFGLVVACALATGGRQPAPEHAAETADRPSGGRAAARFPVGASALPLSPQHRAP